MPPPLPLHPLRWPIPAELDRRVRDDGVVLRTATPTDLDEIADLLARRGEAADGVDLGLVAADADEGLGAVLVAVDDGRIVSTATLLAETWRVEDVALPAGQIELVATEPAFEGRGLVRSLVDLAHDRSRARGDALQVMIGIPYFYRQFGYVYSLPIADTRELVAPPPRPDGIRVHVAGPGDLAALAALQDQVQRDVPVSMPHSPACWRWLIARDGSAQWLAERDGVALATCRALPPDEGLVLGEIAGAPDGIEALLAHAVDVATASATSAPVAVMDRPNTAVQATLDPLLAAVDRPEASRHWYYLRIERLAPVLTALSPVLERRWRASGLGPHDLLLSSYRSHVRMTVGLDGVGPVREGGALQAPVSAGGSGVPPDVLAPLLFGPHGALGLEERHADVLLGRQRDLMAALFPPVASDLLTFYLPV
jgi:predicted N-acetyltransferase YhbS